MFIQTEAYAQSPKVLEVPARPASCCPAARASSPDAAAGDASPLARALIPHTTA